MRHHFIISEYSDTWVQNYTSDIVRLACDIAYLPRSLARDIVFDEEHIFQYMVDLKQKVMENPDHRGSQIRASTEGNIADVIQG